MPEAVVKPPKKFWGHPDDWPDEAWEQMGRMQRSWNPIDKIKLWLWGY